MPVEKFHAKLLKLVAKHEDEVPVHHLIAVLAEMIADLAADADAE